MLLYAEVTVTAGDDAGTAEERAAVTDQLARKLGARSWDAPEWFGYCRAYRAAGAPTDSGGEPIAFFLDIEVEAADVQTAKSYLQARIRLPDGWSLRAVAVGADPPLRPHERAERAAVCLNPAIPSVDNRDIEQGSRGVVERVERMGLRRPRYLVRFDDQLDGTLRGWVIAEELFPEPRQ